MIWSCIQRERIHTQIFIFLNGNQVEDKIAWGEGEGPGSYVFIQVLSPSIPPLSLVVFCTKLFDIWTFSKQFLHFQTIFVVASGGDSLILEPPFLLLLLSFSNGVITFYINWYKAAREKGITTLLRIYHRILNISSYSEWILFWVVKILRTREIMMPFKL